MLDTADAFKKGDGVDASAATTVDARRPLVVDLIRVDFIGARE
jgi:hypothetical protein